MNPVGSNSNCKILVRFLINSTVLEIKFHPWPAHTEFEMGIRSRAIPAGRLSMPHFIGPFYWNEYDYSSVGDILKHTDERDELDDKNTY